MTRRVCVGFVLGLLAVPPILAQPPAPSPPSYDRSTETVLTGSVVGVDAYTAANGTVAVHLEVDTGRGVHVAPALFIGQNSFWLLKDDVVSIVGARTAGRQSGVWARTISKGASMLVLRNEDGTPRWTPATDGADGCGVDHRPLAATTER